MLRDERRSSDIRHWIQGGSHTQVDLHAAHTWNRAGKSVLDICRQLGSGRAIGVCQRHVTVIARSSPMSTL